MARYSVLAFNESEMPKSVHLDVFEFFYLPHRRKLLLINHDGFLVFVSQLEQLIYELYV
jgi:hypothetical protein